MSRPTIINSAQALSVSDIAALEARLGAALPPAYQEFLLTQNGGQPQPSAFQFIRGGKTREWTWVGGLKSVTPPTTRWINVEATPDWKKAEIPEGGLEIGYGPESQGIILFLSGPRKGQVWYKDYESCEDEGVPEEELHFLAPDLNAFLATLTEKPEDAEWIEDIA